VADVYLADRTQRRTAAGAQLTQLAGRRGCALLFLMAASAIQLPSAADRIPSLVPRDLRAPNKPGRCSAVSLWWPASTNSQRDEIEAVAFDGDGRRQDPHLTPVFYVVSQLGDPGFRPRVRPLTRESGLVD